MSNELHYWHETDDPHRIEAKPPVDSYGGAWKPESWPVIPTTYRVRDIDYTQFHVEPDVIKTRDGGSKLVGLSLVPNVRYPRSLTELAQSKEVSIASIDGALTQGEIKRMRQQMEQDFMSSIHAVMLRGEPLHDDTITINDTTYTFKSSTQPTHRSLLTRLKMWLRWRWDDLRCFYRRLRGVEEDDEDYDE